MSTAASEKTSGSTQGRILGRILKPSSEVSFNPKVLQREMRTFGTTGGFMVSPTDGSYNVAPMSSAFWLGRRCILGLAAVSQTPINMLRTKECVLNLASVDNVEAVNRLARTPGSNPVPEVKVRRGYRFVREKFELANLTPLPAETVGAPRVQQCPVQLEAKLEAIHGLIPNSVDSIKFLRHAFFGFTFKSPAGERRTQSN
jgi:flavin reductase (DIM6/NTAB) family NADH-FMN oxidoreductase RutF